MTTTQIDTLFERHAQRIGAKFFYTDSFVHGLKMRRFEPIIEVQNEDGDIVSIRAIDIRKAAKKFLMKEGKHNLTVLAYQIPPLAQTFSDDLRKQKNSKYRWLKDKQELNWLYNVCFLALTEEITLNIYAKDAFIDGYTATQVLLAHGLRKMRGYAAEGPNHDLKHKSSDDERESTIDTWCGKFSQLVDDLASKSLLGYDIPELPEGVEHPLLLPMGVA